MRPQTLVARIMKTSTQTKPKPRIIVRKQRVWRSQSDHSAWKVAFADFTTAMMAFFLLLWLLEHASESQKLAISGYFVQPGGALTSSGVNAGLKLEAQPVAPTPRLPTAAAANWSEQQLREQFQQRELEVLEQLRQSLQQEMQKNGSAFDLLKGQIFIDISALGLRIQIVDKAQRPMFDLGSDTLKPYSREVLHALAPLLNKVPNRIAISGHTDSVTYGTDAVYSNWELSVDRANRARRALLEGSYPEQKVAAAQGMSNIALYKPEAPNDPANRRIAIIVLKRAAEKSAVSNPGAATPTPAAPR
jgi:chemotaxis protein MotB